MLTSSLLVKQGVKQECNTLKGFVWWVLCICYKSKTIDSLKLIYCVYFFSVLTLDEVKY